jgi:predicted alpha/beta superfamily hydrolase
LTFSLALAACGGQGAAGTSTSGGAPHETATTIRIHYPAGSHTLTLRGSEAPLSWDHGMALDRGPDDTWTATFDGLPAGVDWKPMLDDAPWSLGPNYHVDPGESVDAYPRFDQVAGQYFRDAPLTSKILGNTRGIWVYLPPTYLENTLASFPVLYMHDGQNLFDPAASYSGQTWQVQQTMDAAAMDGSIAEAVVVGIENTPDRMNEYTPWPDPTWMVGGTGDAYLRMIVEELKPRIDASYRTRTEREHTAIIGSSLGGIISSYGGVVRADVFGLVGALSPTTWWDGREIIATVETVPTRPERALRVYVDSGDAGVLPGEPPDDDVIDTRDLAAAYRGVGYVEGSTLRYLVQHGGTHDEQHWAERLPGALAFLLGKRAP